MLCFNRLIALTLVCFSLLTSSLAGYLYAEGGDGGSSSGSGGETESKDIMDCPDSGILSGKMLTDIPWNALYPIRIAGISIIGGVAPKDATNKAGCLCEDDLGVPKPGLTNSLWEPARVVELVREPGCFMSLAGAEMGIGDKRNKGTVNSASKSSQDLGMWHYHYYAYPLLLLLELWYPGRCSDGVMDFDLMYMSEVDPTWYDDELAFFTQPESSLFANAAALAACSADAIASSVSQPIDELYWCAGTWGTLYPFTGLTLEKGSTAANTSLLATKAIASLHRKGLARKTMGDESLCRPIIYPTIPRSQYKMSLFYPNPETGAGVSSGEDSEGSGESGSSGSGSSSESDEGSGGDGEEKPIPEIGGNSRGTHWIGELDFKWGIWRFDPARQDAVYVLWRWTDCCNTLY